MEYTYEDLKTQIEGLYAGWTVTYSPLTDAADFMHASGSFDPDGEDGKLLGIGITTGRFLENQKPIFNKEGHVKSIKWSGHLYLSLEPFNKLFVANDDDPYAEYPDSFPPDNDREPLRKLFIVNEDTVTYPEISSAQLPKAFISYDYSSTTTITDSDSKYRYGVQKSPLFGDLTATAPFGTAYIWFERGIGPSPTNNQTVVFWFQSLPVAADRIDDFNDYVGAQPPWGTFFLYYQDFSEMNATEFVSRTTALLNSKKGSNIYGSSFEFVVYTEGVSPDAGWAYFGGITDGLEVSLWTNIPPDGQGNTVYSYGASLRDSYNAQFEGAPREFIFDGPTSLTTLNHLGEIQENQVFVTNMAAGTKYFFNKFPQIWVGLSKTAEYDSSLYLDDHLACNVFRTLANGTESYLSKTIYEFIPIGSATVPDCTLYDENWERDVATVFVYGDIINDTDISERELAYYNGGVALYDALPQGGGYYFTVVNQTGYYANIIGNVQRVYESPPGVPHAAPGLFFDDFDDAVSGISHFSDKPIIFTPNTTWRWEGTNGATGAGRTFIRVISDEYGCIANQSIVRTNSGLFYWSKTGIIFTDGLRAVRVTEHLIDRYGKWLSYIRSTDSEIGPKQLRGVYDEINRRVLWSILDQNGDPALIVLDIFEGVTDTMPVFYFDGNVQTYWNGSAYERTIQVETNALLYTEEQNCVYRGQDTRVLINCTNKTYDEYWDGTTTLQLPIKTSMKSIAIDYGSRSDRKWTSRIMWNFDDLSQNGVSMQPLGWNDLTEEPHYLFPCVNYQHIVWSEDYSIFPDMTLQQFFQHLDVSWKAEHIVSYNRMFPRGRIRNVYKQVGFEPLPVKLVGATVGDANVTDIKVSYKSGTGRNLVEVTVTVSDTGDNAIKTMGVDNSGAFYLKWANQDRWTKIENFDLTGFNYTFQVFTSDEVESDFSYTDVTELIVGRVLNDQKIKMSDYTMTFRVVGDSTHGLVRPENQGGDNGN